MKSIFNNQIVRMVRDEVNDLRKKDKDTKPNQETSSIPSAPPTYYHHPSSTSSTTDSYSHTANSTAGYSQRNAYPTLINTQEREKQSLIGKIESTATSLIGTIVGQDTVVSATNKLNNVVTSGHNARELLKNGAIVQLISKHSGHLLQVVMSSNGILVFDGSGANNAFNTYFTVEESEKGRVRFHNNYNYLAFEGKQACIMSFPPGPKNSPNIDFRVHDILGSSELVAFESCACKNYFISITADGHLKTMNIKDKNIDAQFSVALVTNNQQPMFPHQIQPYQQFDMNPYGGFPSNGASGYTSPQPVAPPPPPYSAQNPYSQPSASSGLYPRFN